jgi:hypothetical protein
VADELVVDNCVVMSITRTEVVLIVQEIVIDEGEEVDAFWIELSTCLFTELFRTIEET